MTLHAKWGITDLQLENFYCTGMYAGVQNELNSADATYILRKSTIFNANAFSKIRMSRLLDNKY